MSTLALEPLGPRLDVDVPGATLAAEAGGDGPPVLLLHAGVADRRVWRPLAPHLAEDHRLISYDRRGFGDTTASAADFDPVADLLAVLDAFDVERATLVGNSMGGTLAIDATLAHPDRVDALVVMAPGWSGGPYDQFEQDMDDVVEMFVRIKAADDVGDLDEVNRLECHIWLDGPRADEGRVTGDARDLFLAMNGRALELQGSVGAEASYPDAWEHLPSIGIPSAVVQGSLDEPGSAEIGEAAATHMNASFVVLDGVAHLPSLEVPERTASVIRDVVARRR